MSRPTIWPFGKKCFHIRNDAPPSCLRAYPPMPISSKRIGRSRSGSKWVW